jgi:hypothetical protein
VREHVQEADRQDNADDQGDQPARTGGKILIDRLRVPEDAHYAAQLPHPRRLSAGTGRTRHGFSSLRDSTPWELRTVAQAVLEDLREKLLTQGRESPGQRK